MTRLVPVCNVTSGGINMDENTAVFKPQERSLDFILKNMIRHQKYASAAAAKKAVAALRAQLHQELEKKKLCTYQPHECSQLTLDGYDYCLRHIMEDKTAPFRQCSYVYNSNGKRCHLPAPKGEKKEQVFCKEHAFKTHLTKVRTTARHFPTNSLENLLDSLSHYVSPQEPKASTSKQIDIKSSSATDVAENEQLKATESLDPHTEIDATKINGSRCRILDYGSESESDVEPATYSSVWHDAHADSSDDESIDSEQEDILKHAGVYTAEEVFLVTRDKLIRLQSMYIEQFKYLQHVLKERRRKYLHTLKREKDSLSKIYDQVHDTPKERRMYQKLKAFNHYHKKHGTCAIVNNKFTNLRSKLPELGHVKPQPYTKCSFVEGGVKCFEPAMPMTKHCMKHILYDQNQVLFKQCCRVQADIECNESSLGIFSDPMCRYHINFPPKRNYGETRTFGDETDTEDSSDTHYNQVNDMLASSSCDSKTTPFTVTSTEQIMDFSNQFPSQHDDTNLELFQDPQTDELLDIDNTSTDYITESNEIDVVSVEDNMPFASSSGFSGQDESNSSLNARSVNVMDQVIEVENNEEVETELSVIDPDDDMAGIMLELQKDNNSTNEPN